MQLIRLSSRLGKPALLGKCKELGIAAFLPSLIVAEEQAELAAALARRSFAGKRNIAKTMELEFLLWLSGEGDLRSALAKNDFSPSDFFAAVFGKTGKKGALRALEAKEKPLALREKASALELEKVSLSRIS